MRAQAGLVAPGIEDPDGGAFRSGWAAFDGLRLVRPGRLLLLDLGAPQGHRLTLDALAGALATGRQAVVVDGSNWLDVYRLGEAAQRHGLSRAAALGQVRVARGFTAHQLQSLVEDALPRLLAEEGAGLVLAPGLPDLYQDEDLDASEARVLLARALATLRAQAQAHATPVLVTNSTLSPHRRTLLRRVLEEGADACLALLPAPHGGLRLKLPDRAPLLAPSPSSRQRTLDDYGAQAPALGDPAAYHVLVPLHPGLRYAAKRAGEDRARRKVVQA